jgi:hypothetical protein
MPPLTHRRMKVVWPTVEYGNLSVAKDELGNVMRSMKIRPSDCWRLIPPRLRRYSLWWLLSRCHDLESRRQLLSVVLLCHDLESLRSGIMIKSYYAMRLLLSRVRLGNRR